MFHFNQGRLQWEGIRANERGGEIQGRHVVVKFGSILELQAAKCFCRHQNYEEIHHS